jgi:hypothetical protein
VGVEGLSRGGERRERERGKFLLSQLITVTTSQEEHQKRISSGAAHARAALEASKNPKNTKLRSPPQVVAAAGASGGGHAWLSKGGRTGGHGSSGCLRVGEGVGIGAA